MATRSRVGFKNPDGTVNASYVHFDGYLEGVGIALQYNHNNDPAAKKLGYAKGIRSIETDTPVSFYGDMDNEVYESEDDFYNGYDVDFAYLYDPTRGWLFASEEYNTPGFIELEDQLLADEIVPGSGERTDDISEDTDYDERRKKESDYYQEEEDDNSVNEKLNDMMRDMDGEDLDDFLAFYAPEIDNTDANAITDWAYNLDSNNAQTIIDDLLNIVRESGKKLDIDARDTLEDEAALGLEENKEFDLKKYLAKGKLHEIKISSQAAELVDGFELEDLERNLEDIYRDMEQEAEPEGGPIADRYADEITHHEEAIQFIKNKGKKQAQMPYDVAVGKITQDEYDTIVSKDQFNKSSKFDRRVKENFIKDAIKNTMSKKYMFNPILGLTGAVYDKVMGKLDKDKIKDEDDLVDSINADTELSKEEKLAAIERIKKDPELAKALVGDNDDFDWASYENEQKKSKSFANFMGKWFNKIMTGDTLIQGNFLDPMKILDKIDAIKNKKDSDSVDEEVNELRVIPPTKDEDEHGLKEEGIETETKKLKKIAQALKKASKSHGQQAKEIEKSLKEIHDPVRDNTLKEHFNRFL